VTGTTDTEEQDMSHYDDWAADVYGTPRTVNIATGNAVVGSQVGGRPEADAFAWVRDDRGELWILTGRWGYGGLYAKPEDMTITASIRSINVAETGPEVRLA
jgi:hypothetical protein